VRPALVARIELHAAKTLKEEPLGAQAPYPDRALAFGDALVDPSALLVISDWSRSPKQQRGVLR